MKLQQNVKRRAKLKNFLITFFFCYFTYKQTMNNEKKIYVATPQTHAEIYRGRTYFYRYQRA